MEKHETDDQGRAVCRKCGNSFKRISKHVENSHQISMEEYFRLPAWPGIKEMEIQNFQANEEFSSIDERFSDKNRYLQFGVGKVLSFGKTPLGAEDISKEFFSEEAQSYIPDVDPSFVPNPDIMEMLALGVQMSIPTYCYGPTGCHAPGTNILMSNGDLKSVEDVKVGEKIMGPDQTPRTVHTLYSGSDCMYEILPVIGDSFVVNKSHVLSLVDNHSKGKINITVEDYLKKSDDFRNSYKLYRCSIIDSFEKRECEIEQAKNPYIAGLLWEEEFDELNSDKPSAAYHVFIPPMYKYSNSDSRFELLAGILDSNSNFGDYLDFISKSKSLNEDVAFVARSLGFSVSNKSYQEDFEIYYKTSIFGNIDLIPTRLNIDKKSEKNNIENSLETSFSIKILGIGKYYGFGVDKDNLYVMGDFTVTHNSGKTSHIWHLAALTKTPIRRINLHGDTRASDLMGTREVVIDSDGNSITQFNPGVVTQCMENGWWLLLDELDCAKTGISMVLQSILERTQGNKKVYIPNYGIVNIHPFFRIFGTGNTNGRGEFMELYPGTQVLNEAFMDRFSLATYVPYNWSVIRKALPKRIPGCENYVETILKVAEEIEKAFEQEDCYFTLSPRKVFIWAEVIKLYESGYKEKSMHIAASHVIMSKLGADDRIFFAEIYQRITGHHLLS